MMAIVLARHGESEFTARGVANGDPSIGGGLTAAGREQAESLHRWLAGREIDLGVASEFVRTRETLDIALEERRVPVLILPQLDDIRYGAFEGRPLDAYHAWAREHGLAERLPGGGESRADLVRRFCEGLRMLLERPERAILVVAHELPITYVLDAAQGKPPAAIAAHVGYAAPHELSESDLRKSLELLESWAEEI